MKVYLVYALPAFAEYEDGELIEIFSSKMAAVKYMSDRLIVDNGKYDYYLEEWTVKS